MALVSIVDSYYKQVKAQMAAIQAKITVPIAGVMTTINQPFGGVLNASDWPQVPIINQATPEGTLYLLIVNAVEIEQSRVSSQAQTLYEFQCQWNWVLLGNDIQSNQQALNRGDRYRTNMQILENLQQAQYPGFCRQQDYTVDAEGNITSTPSQTPYPVNPYEVVRWSNFKVMPKNDNAKSGVVYGAAQISVFGYSNVIPAIA